MPPLNPIEDIKDILPSTDAATNKLATTAQGALFVVSIVVLIISLLIMVFTAVHFSEPVEQARKEQELRDKAVFAAMVSHYEAERQDKDSTIWAQFNKIHELQDSLMKMSFIHQFNISQQENKIIITPK